MEALTPKNKSIVFLARKNSKPLAGVMLLANHYICHYWNGVHLNNPENEGQGELLQWEAIRWAKEKGTQFYDLCIVGHIQGKTIAFKL